MISDREGFEIVSKTAEEPLLAPLDLLHEVWSSNATYPESSEASGVATDVKKAHDKDHSSGRPEIFFKAVGWRTVGNRQSVRIRGDSNWNVPQPELVLIVNQHEEIVGYSVGNDMTSRGIERENPLYLSQARTYDDSCAIGPGIMIADPDSMRGWIQPVGATR